MATQELLHEPVNISPEPPMRGTRRMRLPRSWSWTLWLCLLASLLIRTWLVIHTHGVIEGDEALVGLQAQHILRGERPIYFYAQPYMGSLEAYLLAGLFAIAGSSVWTLRAEPILLSLLLIWLTWRLADGLAIDLPSYARQWFRTVAAFFAALPPLYDIVLEMRTYGGYIETLILMLLLLFAVVHLIRRWYVASWRELSLRWSGIGLIIGVGFWVYPLIIVAVLAASLWILGFCAIESFKSVSKGRTASAHCLRCVVRPLAFLIVAIPAALLGAAPALYWGATHKWANILYLLKNSDGSSQNRLQVIKQVTHLYATCTSLRVIGGAVPTEPDVSMAHPHLLTMSLLLGALCIVGVAGALALSLVWQHPTIAQVRQLVSLPLLFALCSAFIFCVSSISATGLHTGCGPKDLVGRYAAPLLLALPFFVATLFALIIQFMHDQNKRWERSQRPERLMHPLSSSFAIMQVVLAVVLCLYLGMQTFSYRQASSNYLFQTSGCVIAPLDDTSIIDYMRREHIRYAWATSWVANPITFKTQGSIIVVDPRIVAYPANFINRIPAYTAAVADANRASALILVPQGEQHPQLLKQLDAEHIIYRVARFPSEPGYQLLVVTPLRQRISPKVVSDTSAWFGRC